MLPIVRRELALASRNPKLYERRVWFGFVQAVVIGAILIASGGGFRTTAATSLFETLSRVAVFLCLLEGVRKASDVISSEKREGTLGFLFLSTLSGSDVVLGKLAGALTRALSVLLAFLPVLAICLLVGGTTLGEFFRVSLTLLSTLLAAHAFCLLVSVLSRERAVSASILLLAMGCTLPLFASTLKAPVNGLELLSPFTVLAKAGDLEYGRGTRAYWLGIALLWLNTVVALTLASFLVRRVWQPRPPRAARKLSPRARRRKRALLDVNPVLWLAYETRGQSLFTIVSAVLLLVGAAPVIWFRFDGHEIWSAFPALAGGGLLFAVWLRVAVQTATRLAEAKNDGSIELLLSTPLQVNDVMKGYWLAIWKTVRVPMVCVILLLGIALAAASDETTLGEAIWISNFVIELLLQAVVLAAVGMWMGLRSKTRAAAVVYTILLGGILPWVFCILPMIVQIALIWRALDRVKVLLGRIRAGRADVAFPVFTPRTFVPQTVPPVIR